MFLPGGVPDTVETQIVTQVVHDIGLGEGHSICQDLHKRYFTETTLVQIGVGRVGQTTRGYGIIKYTPQVPDTQFLMPLEFPE